MLNVTEDSFSDGGDFIALEASVDRIKQIYQEGAKILDIGAESSRPGSLPVSSDIQIQRILPVFQEINKLNLDQLSVSIDTTHSKVASLALHQGATIVNDITAGQSDPDMLPMVADTGASIILMHMQGTPENMQKQPRYNNVTKEIKSYLAQRVKLALMSGINDIIIDPGFGFGKTVSNNFSLLKEMNVLNDLNCPILIGVSRKSMIYKTIGGSPISALNGTSIIHAWGLERGASILRVHDVKEAKECIDLFLALG